MRNYICHSYMFYPQIHQEPSKPQPEKPQELKEADTSYNEMRLVYDKLFYHVLKLLLECREKADKIL